jgi:hypothetical protein
MEIGPDIPSKSGNCSIFSWPNDPCNTLCLIGITISAAFLTMVVVKKIANIRGLSLAPSSFQVSGFSGFCGKDQKALRDPATVTYVGRGRDRLSIELCQTCIESNKMLKEFSLVMGSSTEAFEPCELCR